MKCLNSAKVFKTGTKIVKFKQNFDIMILKTLKEVKKCRKQFLLMQEAQA